MRAISKLAPYTHPHQSPFHVMIWYRTRILSFKRSNGPIDKRNRCARGLMHYSQFVETYFAAKREYLAKNLQERAECRKLSAPLVRRTRLYLNQTTSKIAREIGFTNIVVEMEKLPEK